MQGGSTLTHSIPIPGYYATGDSAFDPSLFIGKTIYTFITNGNSLGATSAYQFALISFAGKLSVTADPVIPPANSYNLFAADGTIVYGQAGHVTHSDPAGGDFDTIQLAVPEPSAVLPGLLGIAGLVRRRR